MISVLYSSFELIPIASGDFSIEMILSLLTWSSQIFIGAVVIAFPIMIGLLGECFARACSACGAQPKCFCYWFPRADSAGSWDVATNHGDLVRAG